MYLEKARYWTVRDIEKIIHNNLTEMKNLEFKRLAALTPDSKNEISKDISSFANSGGGIIIYGIAETKEGNSIILELEDGLDSNDRHGKEWLENVIMSRISPKIEGLYINPIKLENERYIYAVIIPQSNTAHMAGNHRYYKRHNFKSEPMEDYEVRDVMNRMDKPRLKLIFTVPKVIDSNGGYSLRLLLVNIGESFVRHFSVRIAIPENIIKGKSFKGGRKKEIDGLWYRQYIRQSNPNQYIFPGYRTFINSKFLPTLDAATSKTHTESYIYWTIYTDKSGPIYGKTPLEVVIRDRLNVDNE